MAGAGIAAVGVGVWDYFNDKNEIKRLEAAADYERAAAINQTPKTLRTAIIVSGIVVVFLSIRKLK